MSTNNDGHPTEEELSIFLQKKVKVRDSGGMNPRCRIKATGVCKEFITNTPGVFQVVVGATTYGLPLPVSLEGGVLTASPDDFFRKGIVRRVEVI